MTRDPIDIFRQIGLAEGEGCLTRTLADSRNTSVLELRDAGGGPPTAESERFQVRLINPDNADGGWLELPDAPLADAVALTVADANMFLTNDGDQPPEALSFVLRDTNFVNPFADDQFCDWTGDRDGRGVWVLQDPRLAYGGAYERWAASLLDLADRGGLGPLVASAYAAYLSRASGVSPR